MKTGDVIIDPLFQRIANGDEQAFTLFFRQYHTRFLRFACLYVPSMESAEDLVSEVLIKLLKKKERVFTMEQVIPYIYQCIKNSCYDFQQKEKKRFASTDLALNDRDYFGFDNATPLNQLVHSEFDTIIRNCIEGLPPRRREVFKLIKDEQLSYKEAGEIMGISDRTVEVHLKLAIKELKDTIRIYMRQPQMPDAKMNH